MAAQQAAKGWRSPPPPLRVRRAKGPTLPKDKTPDAPAVEEDEMGVEEGFELASEETE